MKKKLGFLDRYLTLWIFLAMALGVGISNLVPNMEAILAPVTFGSTNIPLAIGLIVMMYPPLTKVNFKELPLVFKDVKLLSLSLIQNWVIGPLLMFGLAVLFLRDYPEYFTGLILIGIARCIAMVIVWNDLAGGSRQYVAGLVAFNSVFQVLFYSFYAWLFATWFPGILGLSQAVVAVSISEVAMSVGLYLGLPFGLAILTRAILIPMKGEDWFKNVFLPKISPFTLSALLFTIVLMFSLQGKQLLELPFEVLRIAVPLTAYFIIMFFVALFMARAAGADYSRSVSLAFTAAGNNFELGIAIAISVFGLQSGQAFATVVGPLIEVPVLILLVRLVTARKAKWFGKEVEPACN